ncbi:restriction endonuclease subunit S [Aquimarina algicola]|nr:restriction endonuclease subunit S [Aquimarina algicola]
MTEKIDLKNLDKSNWTSFKFEEIAQKISKTVKPEEAEVDIYVGLEHLNGEDIHIRRKGIPADVKGGKLRCYPGDIIFGKRRAYQRKAAIVDFDGICSAHAFVFRANPEVIDPKLFPFFLHSNQFMHRMVDISVGGLSPTINWGDLKHQEFLLPPNDQQAQLAKLLWAMDDVIEREKVVLERTEVIKNSLFKKFTSSEENWTKHKIKDLMTFNYGSALKESDRKEGEYNVVTSSGIQGTHNEYKTEGPGIVVGRKGNVGQVTWLDDNFWTTDTAYFVLINEEFKHVPLKFFYYLLIASNLKKHSIATAVPGLNRDDALLTNVFLPTENEISSYLDKFSTLDEKLTDISSKISSSQSLQKSLINQIF